MTCTKCKKRPPKEGRKLCHYCTDRAAAQQRRDKLREEYHPPAEPVTLPVLPEEPPRTRRDCVDGPRPCPWVRCKHHLLLSRKAARISGVLRSDEDLVELLFDGQPSCARDFEEEGAPQVLIGQALDLSHGRVQQIEWEALAEIAPHMRGLRPEGEPVSLWDLIEEIE